MKNIAFTTHNLCLGGVQKNVSLLANALSSTHKVTLILFEDKPFSYHLDSTITVYTLSPHALELDNKTEEELQNIGEVLFDARSKELAHLFESHVFDVVVSFEDYNNLCTLNALKKGMKAIVSSRVSLEYGYKNRLIHLLPPSFYKTTMQKLYPKAECVVSVSDGVKEELAKLGIRAKTIANGIELKKLQTLSQDACALNDEFFLHVGRFDTAQKAQHEVVEAYKSVAKELQSALVFVGDGKDRAKLEALVGNYGLQKRIFFMGFDENPYKYMRKCKGFIFSSYYEGMPNALLEALSLGCAVVAYKFEPSWREFDGKEAVLFIEKGDIKELSKALVRLEKEPILRKTLQKNAQCIIQKYSQEMCQKRWRELIETVAKKEDQSCAEF
ncbi:MAG: glycosyltransferase [Epsilonproteobacteria bacterium]|nr:glycosyltransferase [Campylobacterota bacterium]